MSTTARDLQESRTDSNVSERTLRELAAQLISRGMRSEVGC